MFHCFSMVFAFSLQTFLFLEQRLRDVALKEEENISNFNGETSPTLLGLASSLSRFVQLASKIFQRLRSYKLPNIGQVVFHG